MEPSEFVGSLREHGLDVSTVEIGDRSAFLAKKQMGDLLVQRLMLDLPVHVPASMRLAFGRDFGIPVADLQITAHDL